MDCAYCGAPIVGTYQIDPYGQAAHVAHAKRCFCCGRFVKGGTPQMADGRFQCEDCRKKEVVKDEHIEWVDKRVRQMLARHGIADISENVSFELVVPKVVPGRAPTVSHKMGQTVTMTTRWQMKHKVRMLNHLHRIVFAGVLAHELLHVWQNEHHISLSSELTEGFCNLGSWVVYEMIGTEVARAMMEQLQKDPTPVYGDGFRRVKALYDQQGAGSLAATMNILKRMK